MDVTGLAQDWLQLCEQLGIAAATGQQLWSDLVHAYQTPPRTYHNLAHIAYCLNIATPLLFQTNNPLAVQLALWYHDIIYDSQAADNEARSAAFAHDVLQQAGVSGWLIDEVTRLILLTRTHQTTADDHNGAVLLDADLAILGAAANEYQRYTAAIREEYAWVDETSYRRGRGRVLQHFLQREPIYLTVSLREKLEAKARINLQQEWLWLQSEPV